jgi:hypothetical protein
MATSPHRTRWLLAAVGVVALVIGALVLKAQHQKHARLVAQCRTQRAELAAYRTNVLESRIREMRQIRLNDTQAQALRETDVKAFISYSALYGQKVEAVAQASEHLAELAGNFTSAGCLDIAS